jgi:hypothetical protein
MALERCVTGIDYKIRLVPQDIYDWKDVGGTRKLFRKWRLWVQVKSEQTCELLKPMARAVRMIEGYLDGMLAHWTRGLTTAFMEGLNSLFKAVMGKPSCFPTVEYMATKLYFVAGKLTLPCY